MINKIGKIQKSEKILFSVQIKNLEIMSLLKINLDQVMLITHILKNMALEILEEEVANLLEKQHVE